MRPSNSWSLKIVIEKFKFWISRFKIWISLVLFSEIHNLKVAKVTVFPDIWVNSLITNFLFRWVLTNIWVGIYAWNFLEPFSRKNRLFGAKISISNWDFTKMIKFQLTKIEIREIPITKLRFWSKKTNFVQFLANDFAFLKN